MATLRAPTAKPVVLGAVRPNAGIEAAYRARLDAMIGEMQRSLVHWLRAAYRKNPPKMANDASPAADMRAAMAELTARWQRQFDRAAPELAKYFTTKMANRSDATLRAILRRGGFSVTFKMTAEANDVMQATIGEQVGLIKSIASQHLADVEGLVMRSVAQGRDLGKLTDALEHRYALTRRRAALIARDQNNKATATMTRVRQQGLGITQAVWKHSHAGKEPRPSHVAADGTIYDVDKGLILDGEQVWPGTAINCRCTSKPLIPGFS